MTAEFAIPHLEAWEIDRLTVCEVAADEVLATLDRHKIDPSCAVYVAARNLSDRLSDLLGPRFDGSGLDAQRAQHRMQRLQTAVKMLAVQLPPNGAEFI